MNIPYKIVGGINFYARREIKDILAYLKTVDNGQDDLSVRRIINVPKRGIGLTTINRIQEAADARGISFYDALLVPEMIPGVGRSSSKLNSFAALIEYFKGQAEKESLTDLLNEILDMTGYTQNLEADDEVDAESRLQNIEELLNKAAAYEEDCADRDEKATLSGFLEEVALVADIDSLEEDQDYVVLMTLHSAKGLEFPHVYLAGMEDGLFPSYMTITGDDPEELEEERRLCYVGITRAEQKLTMTCARKRMVRGGDTVQPDFPFLSVRSRAGCSIQAAGHVHILQGITRQTAILPEAVCFPAGNLYLRQCPEQHIHLEEAFPGPDERQPAHSAEKR